MRTDLISVQRAPAGSPGEFVAVCLALDVKAYGASKQAAVDACGKAIAAVRLGKSAEKPAERLPAAEATTEPPVAPKKAAKV
jgi:hypothetical protein